jgi:putative membrane protein
MSAKSGLRRAIGIIIGAQALALGALAQTPDTRQPNDRATTQSPTGGATTTRDASDANSSSSEWDRGADPTRSQSTGENTSSTTSRTGAGAATDHSTMDHSKDQAHMQPVTAQEFATKAATIGKAEVELAQLALNNTKNEEVRLYAERMVKDHTAADQKLRKIAAEENLQLPDKLDAKHQALKQKLAGLKDDAFDREYKKNMEMGHQEAVALFESAAQTQQMPQDLKQFAASTLPTLEKHHDLAQEIDAKESR